jgi:hypothetical protein
MLGGRQPRESPRKTKGGIIINPGIDLIDERVEHQKIP